MRDSGCVLPGMVLPRTRANRSVAGFRRCGRPCSPVVPAAKEKMCHTPDAPIRIAAYAIPSPKNKGRALADGVTAGTTTVVGGLA